MSNAKKPTVFKEANKLGLTNAEYMTYLLDYYEKLTNGRAKPNNKTGGSVRESNQEKHAIHQVQSKLADIFNLDTKLKSPRD